MVVDGDGMGSSENYPSREVEGTYCFASCYRENVGNIRSQLSRCTLWAMGVNRPRSPLRGRGRLGSNRIVAT